MVPRDPISAFYVIALLLLAASAAAIAWHHQRLSMWVFLLVTALQGVRFSPFGAGSILSGLSIDLAGASVFPEDLFTVLFLGTGIVRMFQRRPSGVYTAAVVCYLAVLTLLLLQLSKSLGVASAVNSCRGYLAIGAVVLWAATVPEPWHGRDVKRAILASAAVAAALASLTFITYGFVSSGGSIVLSGERLDARPTSAAVALLILAGLVVAVGPHTFRRRIRVTFAAWFALVLVLLQHRSVWLAGIFALIVLVLAMTRDRGQRAVGPILTGGLLTLAALPVLFSWGARSDALTGSATNTATLEFRRLLWREATSWQRSPVDWLFGQAANPGRPRTYSFSTHSFYVDALDRVGLVGLVALLVLLAISFRACASREKLLLGSPLMALIVCWLVYGITYQIPSWSWLLVGVIVRSQIEVGSMRGRERAQHIELDVHRNASALARARSVL